MNEFKGIITKIDDDFYYIHDSVNEYIANKNDFLYEDILINQKVIFKPVYNVVLKATLISKDE